MEKKTKKPSKTKQSQLKTDELITLLKKVQADFENYKKRTEKEKTEFAKFASSELIRKLLPFIDSFELALNNCPDEGIKLLYRQMTDILSQEGLKKIESLGKKFNPFFHEALLQEQSDKPAGTVIEELQAGFMLNDVVLRHAKVKVAKNETKDNKKHSSEKDN